MTAGEGVEELFIGVVLIGEENKGEVLHFSPQDDHPCAKDNRRELNQLVKRRGGDLNSRGAEAPVAFEATAFPGQTTSATGSDIFSINCSNSYLMQLPAHCMKPLHLLFPNREG